MSGRVCSKRLEEHFRNLASSYPKKYEFQRIFELHQDRIVWPADLLRGRKSSHHPVLFYTFLNCFEIDLPRLIGDFSDQAKYLNQPKPHNSIKPAISNNLEIVRRRHSFNIAYASAPAKKTADYAWLYRNDRAWLQTYISEHRKPVVVHDLIDWAKRDHELAEMVKSAVAEIKALIGPPIQISLAAICRTLSVPPDTFRYRYKTPRSLLVIKENLETRHDFQVRKMAWAASVLIAEDKVRNRSNLLRKASVRVCYLKEEEIAMFFS